MTYLCMAKAMKLKRKNLLLCFMYPQLLAPRGLEPHLKCKKATNMAVLNTSTHLPKQKQKQVEGVHSICE